MLPCALVEHAPGTVQSLFGGALCSSRTKHRDMGVMTSSFRPVPTRIVGSSLTLDRLFTFRKNTGARGVAQRCTFVRHGSVHPSIADGALNVAPFRHFITLSIRLARTLPM